MFRCLQEYLATTNSVDDFYLIARLEPPMGMLAARHYFLINLHRKPCFLELKQGNQFGDETTFRYLMCFAV